MQGIQAGELTNNLTNVLGDTQQQAKKADKAYVSQQAGVQKNGQEHNEAVKVSLSGEGRRAAATIRGNVQAGNTLAVQQAKGSQNVETAQAIKTNETAKQVAAINNNVAQNPLRQTQKTINRIVTA